ncbi:hypothetical protein RHSIM_Rhsim06G0178800 [Rhododendron simsii]|uniref:Serine-rich protein-like protein n=1 Tax=Rhododendron simsii TaxID=118357 RepID=A0A834GSZ2_RHOSS|nr:hypothetical protein RHSIM_Rhsim06G0178800 [Rhododendron simsii]
MDQTPRKQQGTSVLPNTTLEEVKSSTALSSPPPSPRALQKSSSVKQNCLCSPTTHAGSFRCRYHRNPSFTRSSSVGSKLSMISSKLSEFEPKPSRMCDQLHA